MDHRTGRRAIAVAEELSELILAADAAYGKASVGFDSGTVVWKSIERVNTGTGHHGRHIPPLGVTPHMFRKTMAMLTETEPGGEIALGIQLKHLAAQTLANRTTHSYGANDTQLEKLLGTAVEQARFQRLSDFNETHHDGDSIGFGPGADQLKKAFDDVKAQMEELVATGKALISIRFGKLNPASSTTPTPSASNAWKATWDPRRVRGPLTTRNTTGTRRDQTTTVERNRAWLSVGIYDD